MTASDHPRDSRPPGNHTSRFPMQGLGFVLRQPPTQDYARQLGHADPKDGWAKGPADPGPKPQPGEPEPDLYGAVH